jgi:hypothetical protein
MKKPPVLLAVFAIAYLAFLVWQIAADYKPVLLGRLAVTLVLFFFVFRGSRIAGNILAVLCCISALVLLVAAIATFNANATSAILLTVTAGLLLAFAAYLFFSGSVRKFQGKALLKSAA